ncbi:MAG: immune inhibitor A domain-containing protein [Candidatus Aphodosoma sp.]
MLTILIQFPDCHFQNPDSVKQYYTNMMNQHNFIAHGDNVPTGSVSDYWKEASYGKLNVSSVVVGPFTASKNKNKYWTKIKDFTNARKLAAEAVKAAAKVVNMKDFDGADGDNTVDAVNIVYAGYGSDDRCDGNSACHTSHIQSVSRQILFFNF